MKHKYRNLADMEDDMMLLCQNARKFNEEGSQIYTDSLELENAYLESRAKIDSGLLEFGESGDEEATPTSSSQTSSVHVVEMDSYLSDNSDGECCCVLIIVVKLELGIRISQVSLFSEILLDKNKHQLKVPVECRRLVCSD